MENYHFKMKYGCFYCIFDQTSFGEHKRLLSKTSYRSQTFE